MKFQINRKTISTVLITVFAAFSMACQNQSSSNSAASAPPKGEGGKTPTDAYVKLYTAVKSKQTDAIKAVMSEKSLGFARSVSQRQNQPLEKVLENGFTATTFAESMPEIRDERVKGDSGAVEVYNAIDSRWEDLPFVKEDGSWRLAIGNQFAGTFESPGKGRAQLESEAAGEKIIPIKPAAMSNSNSVKIPNAAAPGAKTNVEKK
jgi:hypothetical protein